LKYVQPLYINPTFQGNWTGEMSGIDQTEGLIVPKSKERRKTG
jgi:hypothetical protein